MRCQARTERCEAIPWEKSPVIVTIFTARSHPADATHIRPSVGIGASSIGTKKGEIRRQEDESPVSNDSGSPKLLAGKYFRESAGCHAVAARGFSRRRRSIIGDKLNLGPTRECDCDERTM